MFVNPITAFINCVFSTLEPGNKLLAYFAPPHINKEKVNNIFCSWPYIPRDICLKRDSRKTSFKLDENLFDYYEV